MRVLRSLEAVVFQPPPHENPDVPALLFGAGGNIRLYGINHGVEHLIVGKGSIDNGSRIHVGS